MRKARVVVVPEWTHKAATVYLQFVGLQGEGMFSRVDVRVLGSEFQVPVFIAQGAEDFVTVPDVAKRFFDGISAPEKRFVLVPGAGHDPNRPMLNAVYGLISRYVRPVTRRSRQRLRMRTFEPIRATSGIRPDRLSVRG